MTVAANLSQAPVVGMPSLRARDGGARDGGAADGGANGAPSGAPLSWRQALLAAAVLAVDPAGVGGVRVRARAGRVRDRWLAEALAAFGAETPHRRIAAGMPDGRLTGGLDIARTLESGRPVVETGLLAAVDGGVLVLAMAERAGSGFAAIIGSALDEKIVRVERDGLSARHPARFALIALDEGIDGEGLAPALGDRVGLTIDLERIGWREAEGPAADFDLPAARALLPSVVAPPQMVEALCGVALAVGEVSMRRSLQLLRTARAAAALRGSVEVTLEDATLALRLVLGLEAPTDDAEAELGSEPEPPQPDESEPPEAPSDRREEPDDAPPPGEPEPLTAEALQDMMIEAVEAALPAGLLSGLTREAGAKAREAGSTGRSGADRPAGARGRAIGTSPKPPVPGARLDILATLRQAAPWQRLRAAAAPPGPDDARPRLRLRKSDFRYLRRHEPAGTTAIFVVDASGSAAVERLAETKGAIELLLGECYVRRDSVALVAFRGRDAQILLEPTRSLVRAKRSLSALPGGGATPLAHGIAAAYDLALASLRKGRSVVTIFLTDGRGNIALDGGTARDAVDADTRRAARLFRAHDMRTILIDTARTSQPRAVTLGTDLGAEYLALPRARAGVMARAVAARMEG